MVLSWVAMGLLGVPERKVPLARDTGGAGWAMSQASRSAIFSCTWREPITRSLDPWDSQAPSGWCCPSGPEVQVKAPVWIQGNAYKSEQEPTNCRCSQEVGPSPEAMIWAEGHANQGRPWGHGVESRIQRHSQAGCV